jgi:hypothetical protein
MYRNYSNPFTLLENENFAIAKRNKTKIAIINKVKECKIFKECKICCDKYSTTKFTILKCGHELCDFCLIDIIKLPHNGGYIDLIPKCPFCRIKIKYHDGIKNIKIINILRILANKKNKSKSLKLMANQKYCFCSECNDIFVAYSNCGDDLNRLPKNCMKCHDKSAYIYDIKTCSWCKSPYIKLDGCNIVGCVCGHYTCDLCGEHIANYDRIHFPNRGNGTDRYFKNKCAGRGFSEFSQISIVNIMFKIFRIILKIFRIILEIFRIVLKKRFSIMLGIFSVIAIIYLIYRLW